MLRFENFSKTYRGGKRAVDSLTLHVEPGDIYGFIGHNGAGKTTAIRSAVGVLDFTEGDIFINGVSVKADPCAASRILHIYRTIPTYMIILQAFSTSPLSRTYMG